MEKMIAALEKIATTNGIFYADEIGLNGGTIKMLHNAEYVKPTGRTKEMSIEIKRTIETLVVAETIQITVKEWEVTALYTNLIRI